MRLEAQRVAPAAVVGRLGLMTAATMTPAERAADEAAVTRLAEIEETASPRRGPPLSLGSGSRRA